MKCRHPHCLRDATVIAKVVAIKGQHRRELMTEIIVCDEHVPNNRQIGKGMKDFLRRQMPGGRIANMFVVFAVQAISLLSEEAAEHVRKRPADPA